MAETIRKCIISHSRVKEESSRQESNQGSGPHISAILWTWLSSGWPPQKHESCWFQVDLWDCLSMASEGERTNHSQIWREISCLTSHGANLGCPPPESVTVARKKSAPWQLALAQLYRWSIGRKEKWTMMIDSRESGFFFVAGGRAHLLLSYMVWVGKE